MSIMFFVYALQSASTGRIYIGQTNNLEKRLARHNQQLPSKPESYTGKNRGPWELVYVEETETRKQAMKREKELKSYQGREYVKTILGR